MFSGRCKFLTEDNLCSVYEKRANICRNWYCGAGKKYQILNTKYEIPKNVSQRQKYS